MVSRGDIIRKLFSETDRQLMERTLAIIKPDAVERKFTGRILAHLEEAGFRIRAIRSCGSARPRPRSSTPSTGSGRSTVPGGVHDVRPRLPGLLEREDAVATLRQVIGATDPAEAAEGTVRALFAESKERNSIHASDAPDTAAREIRFFFAEADELARRVDRRLGLALTGRDGSAILFSYASCRPESAAAGGSDAYRCGGRHRDDPFWEGTELTPHAPLAVRVEAQQAGPDVVVRGRCRASSSGRVAAVWSRWWRGSTRTSACCTGRDGGARAMTRRRMCCRCREVGPWI
jgi:nucleoside-diphosphate kinase